MRREEHGDQNGKAGCVGRVSGGVAARCGASEAQRARNTIVREPVA
jgi:hypothetical protein